MAHRLYLWMQLTALRILSFLHGYFPALLAIAILSSCTAPAKARPVPSLAPVRIGLATASTHARAAQSDLAQMPASPLVVSAKAHVAEVLAQLTVSEAAAAQAEPAIAAIGNQLNTAIAQGAVDKTHAHRYKFWLCLIGAAAALLAALYLHLIALIPPPYNLAAMVGIPPAVFLVLWLFL